MNKASLKKAVLPTIVVTAVFLLNYFWLGRENTIIGPFLTLSFLKFKDMEDYRGCMLRTLGMYWVMAVAAWAALLHPVLNVVCNGLALFWIGYFLIDEYNPLNYFPAGMALIFFQNSPVSLERLPLRLLALTVSFTFIFLLLWVQRLAAGRGPGVVERLAQEGFSLCEQLMEELSGNDLREAADTRKRLCQCNRRLSLKLYEANRASLSPLLPQNRFCGCVACFQMMNDLANQVLSGRVGEGTVQREQMGELLAEFQEMYQKGECVSKRRLRFRENPLDLRSFRLRFALRQVVVMTPCLLYGYLCPWPNGYWLAISVFFMMIPVYENTPGRVAQRIRGSLLGIGVCLGAFALFRGYWPRVLLMTIANYFIYASGSYTSMVMCITCSALALNFGSDSYVVMLLQRLAYTLAGAVLALAGNTWIFRIRAWRQCQYVMELLEKLQRRLPQVSELPGEERIHAMNQLVVKSYLLCSRMEEFNQTAVEERRREDVEQFIQSHMQRVARQMLKNYIRHSGEKSQDT